MKKLPTFHQREKLTIARGRGYGCNQVFVEKVLGDRIVCDRTNHGDFLVVRRRAEGTEWARGWHTPAAYALRTVVALQNQQDETTRTSGRTMAE